MTQTTYEFPLIIYCFSSIKNFWVFSNVYTKDLYIMYTTIFSMEEEKHDNLTEIFSRQTCPRCGYTWYTRSKKIMICCPSCLRRFKRNVDG